MKWHAHLYKDDIVLRPISLSDAERLLKFVNDKEIVRYFNFFGETVTLEQEKAYLQKMISSPNDVMFAIMRWPKNELIGTIGLHETDWINGNARLGLIIWRKDLWGQGYGTKAVKLLVEYFFSSTSIRKIYANVLKERIEKEPGEMNFYKRLGFAQEGELKEEYKLGGEYKDMFKLVLTKKTP